MQRTDASKKPPELAQAAVRYAEQNGETFVIIDTAGRLQIDDDLMRELVEEQPGELGLQG